MSRIPQPVRPANGILSAGELHVPLILASPSPCACGGLLDCDGSCAPRELTFTPDEEERARLESARAGLLLMLRDVEADLARLCGSSDPIDKRVLALRAQAKLDARHLGFDVDLEARRTHGRRLEDMSFRMLESYVRYLGERRRDG